MTPEGIQQLFESSRHNASSTSLEDEEPVLSEAQKARRTAALREALATAQQRWLSGSTELDLVAQKLADGSRDGTTTVFQYPPLSNLVKTNHTPESYGQMLEVTDLM
jgi:hypothetical protein